VPAFWSAVAERSGDTAFLRCERHTKDPGTLPHSKAPSTLRSAGALPYALANLQQNLPHRAFSQARERRLDLLKWKNTIYQRLGSAS
jgi:hypothetical protein